MDSNAAEITAGPHTLGTESPFSMHRNMTQAQPNSSSDLAPELSEADCSLPFQAVVHEHMAGTCSSLHSGFHTSLHLEWA